MLKRNFLPFASVGRQAALPTIVYAHEPLDRFAGSRVGGNSLANTTRVAGAVGRMASHRTLVTYF
eukprot:1880568-Rhodomonas_salina.1